MRTDATWAIGEPGVLRGGVEARVLDAEFSYQNGMPGTVPVTELERSGASLAAYVAYRRALTGAVTAEAMRHDARQLRQLLTDAEGMPGVDAARVAEVRAELDVLIPIS